MTVLGNHTRFALEYSLDENFGGEWMFGRCCYWCGGTQVGDYDLGCSLRDLLLSLKVMPAARDVRAEQELSRFSDAVAFRILDSTLFGRGNPQYEDIANDEQWMNHCIMPPVDVFDSWKGYLLEDQDQQSARLLIARRPYADIWRVQLRRGEVEAVLQAARVALNEMLETIAAGHVPSGEHRR